MLYLHFLLTTLNTVHQKKPQIENILSSKNIVTNSIQILKIFVYLMNGVQCFVASNHYPLTPGLIKTPQSNFL